MGSNPGYCIQDKYADSLSFPFEEQHKADFQLPHSVFRTLCIALGLEKHFEALMNFHSSGISDV